MQHSALCAGHTALFCTALPAALYPRLIARVDCLVRRDLKRRKEGKHGFQRTPSFIHAAVCKAARSIKVSDLECQTILEETLPSSRGGFTDVGYHTGRRETCWPLVKAVVQVGEAYGGYTLQWNEAPMPSCGTTPPLAGLG